MSDALTIRPARDSEAGRLAELIATAFHPIPPNVWLIPEEEPRRKRFVPFFRIWADHALAEGRVDVLADENDEMVAAALWWTHPMSEPPDYPQRVAEAVGEYLPNFEVFDEGMQKMHPDEPHEYLGFLATWPEHQSKGYGSRLLRHRHAELDAAGRCAYLAAASEEARRLYLRHGYTDHGEPMRLPNGPKMWPMWREPSPQG